jgi:hypothetical protein
MSEENKSGSGSQETGFSAEYVKSIREEAASYRIKAKEMEEKYTGLEKQITESKTHSTILEEFTKRGIKADPKWVSLENGKSVTDAVDKFLKDYPQFSVEDKPQRIQGKTPMSPHKTNTNVENTAISELGAVKNDPIARAQLRDHYRNLLANAAKTNFRI